MTRKEQHTAIAEALCDYVWECLHDYLGEPIGGADVDPRFHPATLRAIEGLIASAMLAQYERDEEMWSAVMAAESKVRAAPSAHHL
jgi:hypothetical protein